MSFLTYSVFLIEHFSIKCIFFDVIGQNLKIKLFEAKEQQDLLGQVSRLRKKEELKLC